MHRRRGLLIAALGLAVVGGLLAFAFWPDPQRAAALAAYEALRPGMTPSEAMTAVPGGAYSEQFPISEVHWEFGGRFTLSAGFTERRRAGLQIKALGRRSLNFADMPGWWSALLTGKPPRQWVEMEHWSQP